MLISMPRIKFDHSLIPPSPDLAFELNLWGQGFTRVCGIDEAGRGALAGPVCAACVVFPHQEAGLIGLLNGVRDSKEMSLSQREHWSGVIKEIAPAWGVGFASANEIDECGIIPATRLAVQRALAELQPPPDHLLLDYLTLPKIAIPQTSLIKGDARSLSIAGASILAKTARDEALITLASRYPPYHFEKNKGYGTAQHLAALALHGRSPEHRRTFAPVRDQQLSLGRPFDQVPKLK